MTHDEAFLDDIRTHPAEDAPRLIYADWLEDQGAAAHAEFLRVQCRLARLVPGDPEELELELRQADLLSEVERSPWLVCHPALEGVQWGCCRGIAGGVAEMDVATFLQNPEVFFRQAPLQKLLLRADGASQAGLLDLERLADCPWLARLGDLEILAPERGDTVARVLGRSPHLDRLGALSLQHVGLTDAGLEALVQGPHGPRRLGALYLRYNELGARGLLALVTAPVFEHLRVLHLAANPPLGTDGATALALAPPQPRPALISLNLRDSRIGDGGAAELAAAPGLRRLLALHLGWCGIGPPGAEALARSPYLTELQTLYLPGNQLEDAGVAILAGAPSLARLRRLHLRDNGIGDDGIEALADAPLAELVQLNLYQNGRIGDRGARALAASPHLGQLRELVLDGNPIGDAGARALIESPHRANLQRVRLDTTRLSPAVREAVKQRFTDRLYLWAHA